MYPRLSDIFQDLFGFSLPLPIYSFGAMVAVGVLTAAWLARMELDRMYRAGRIGSVRMRVDSEHAEKSDRRRGSKRVVRETSPALLVNTAVVLAVVMGLIGSKLFHILENLDQFVLDPAGMIFSSGGLTFYGGLLLAGVSIAWYVHRKGLSVPAFADAAAPGLMVAYGIGRIGCHLAGDGDWGIAADMHLKPDWLPTWLWAETYPRAIIGSPAEPVYPTPIYEFLACAVLLFGILWLVRKHPFKNGWLFSLYLVFNGIERFFIEKIRINNEFDLLGMTVTQAEVISSLIVFAGIVGLALTWRRREDMPTRRDEVSAPVPTSA